MTAAESTQKPSKRFFSLKWKTLLILCVLLVAVNVILNILTYNNLNSQFEKQLADSIEKNSAALLEQSRYRLVELASAVAMSAESGGEGGVSREKLNEYLQANWELLQIDWGVESLTVFDPRAITILQQGSTIDSYLVQRLVATVNASLKPSTRVYCGTQCRLYAAIPMLIEGNSQSVMILSSTLADFIVDFSQKNSVGAVLLTSRFDQKSAVSLEKWGMQVSAITNRDKNYPLLEQLAASIGMDDFLLTGKTIKTSENSYFYFNSVDLESESSNHKNFIVLINDVTEQRQEIFQNSVDSILISGLGLFASLVTFLVVLWRPMERINRQARLLPLLAESGFKTVREELGTQQQHGFFYHELDVLEDTAIELSHQLEEMEAQIQSRTNELEFMALYDVLTGMANRRLFTDHLNGLINEYRRYGDRFAVVFIDLDNFKRINDTLGHDAGDELLIEVSKRLKACVRETDTVARLGGDEFTLLLPQISESHNVSNVANAILRSMQRPIKVADTEITITSSIGIAVAPDNGLDSQELMRAADVAMYQAKRGGKNNYHFYTNSMNELVQNALHLEHELRRSLDAKEFVLFYQPIIHLKTLRIVGLEALVRWQHPERGIVAPIEFIGLLEANGWIVELGDLVFEQACKDIKRLTDAGYGDVVVSINLSPEQLHDRMLIEKLKDNLHVNNVAGEQIKFEITENTVMENIDNTIHLLTELKSMGIQLAIDDFGTGYSSLHYLKKLPVDDLKVDRAFVRDIPDDINDMEITAAVIAMAHKLNLKVVAEGIEHEEQLAFLDICSCDFGQGFYFQKPVQIEEIFAVLAKRDKPAKAV